ncbi:methyltransferase [Aureococcus anophagefferens]|nr:methyltransferase [Aureococcus anophagefferens]
MAVSARTKAAAALALLVVVVLVATRPRAPAAPQFEYSAHGFRVNGGPSRPLLEPNEAEYQMSEGGQDRVLWEELFRNDSQADSGFFVEFGARGGATTANAIFEEADWRGLLLEASPTEQKTIGADRRARPSGRTAPLHDSRHVDTRQ